MRGCACVHACVFVCMYTSGRRAGRGLCVCMSTNHGDCDVKIPVVGGKQYPKPATLADGDIIIPGAVEQLRDDG